MFKIPKLVAALTMALLACASVTFGADVAKGWGSWWLPPDRSTHGWAIDSLFNWTFWITMVTFVLVEGALIVFLIQYRRRPDRKKAHFTHGNTRLEMAWTLAPAVILAALAVANKGVWDRLRYSPYENDPNKATLLVIGQQFQWNVVYPGPDKKLGRYLLYPKPSDTKWPGGIKFADVPGPAYLPTEKALAAINKYLSDENPLGKDFSDPDGKDDDWSKTPGREIYLPVNRPIEVQLSSKDVIHDFFLPNYRVKLDAVPGMRGKIHFMATMTSKQRKALSARPYSLDELAAAIASGPSLSVRIDETTKGPGVDKDRTGYRYINPADTKKASIIRNGAGFPDDPKLRAAVIDKLRAAGVTDVVAYEPGYWELVCEELCGQGHFKMRGQVVVVDNDTFKAQFETPKTKTALAN